jgi:tRNA (guanine-N7-)-methyltransferase
LSDPGSTPIARATSGAPTEPGGGPASFDPFLETERLLEAIGPTLTAEGVVLEIGFGRGEVLMEMARTAPERLFLGVEVSRKRAEKGARRIARAGIRNVRVVHATAEYLLSRVLPERSVSECWINFSDPWPKKRHHKRRLVRSETLCDLARVMRPGAALHVATDHAGYAEWIAEAFVRIDGFGNLHAPAPWSTERPERLGTAYEEEFLAEGRSIAYFDYRRADDPPAPESR